MHRPRLQCRICWELVRNITPKLDQEGRHMYKQGAGIGLTGRPIAQSVFLVLKRTVQKLQTRSLHLYTHWLGRLEILVVSVSSIYYFCTSSVVLQLSHFSFELSRARPRRLRVTVVAVTVAFKYLNNLNDVDWIRNFDSIFIPPLLRPLYLRAVLSMVYFYSFLAEIWLNEHNLAEDTYVYVRALLLPGGYPPFRSFPCSVSSFSAAVRRLNSWLTQEQHIYQLDTLLYSVVYFHAQRGRQKLHATKQSWGLWLQMLSARFCMQRSKIYPLPRSINDWHNKRSDKIRKWPLSVITLPRR